ncbi:MAG: ATP-binding protein [Patescibacteria group bacterium]
MTSILISKIFAISSLLAVFILGMIVLKKNPKNIVNRLFFFLTIILNMWIFGTFMILGSSSDELALFWDRFVYLGIVFWPSLQYHFSLSVTYFSLRRKIALGLAYASSFVFLFLIFDDRFISDVFRYTWGAHAKAYIYHDIFLVFLILYIVFFLYVLLKKYKEERDKTEKNRILLYFFGFSVLNIVGGTGFLPAYSIPVPPIFLIAPLIFTIVMAYSIIYLNLMHIKLIVRSYFAYFISFFIIVLPAYLILFFVSIYYIEYILIAGILVCSLAVVIFNPVKNLFFKIFNKLFFSPLYNVDSLVYNLSLCLHSSFDVDKIFKSVIDILSGSFHSRFAASAHYDIKNKKLFVRYNNKKLSSGVKKIVADNKKLKKFFIQNKPAKIKDIRVLIGEEECTFLDYLEENKTELILPIKTKNKQFFYFLFFGEKETGEPYNKKDLRVLELVSYELSMSLENIFLYQSVKEFNVKLKKEVDRATLKLREQNKKLKQLDKMKDEFVGIASHQLRTPLTGIRWSTDVLLKNRDKNLTKNQIQLLNQIKDSDLDLIKLVNDLLDVSHIQSGHKFEIKKEKIILKKLIDEVIFDNIFLIDSKELKVVVKVKKTLQIEADYDKIKQVVQNMLSNACKYSKHGGVVRLIAKSNKDKITFSIEDEGIGVPEEQVVRLFTKFFRANNTASQSVSGTGLGLYIAREIIRAHKGDLFYKPNKNGGSIFYFELP